MHALPIGPIHMVICCNCQVLPVGIGRSVTPVLASAVHKVGHKGSCRALLDEAQTDRVIECANVGVDFSMGAFRRSWQAGGAGGAGDGGACGRARCPWGGSAGQADERNALSARGRRQLGVDGGNAQSSVLQPVALGGTLRGHQSYASWVQPDREDLRQLAQVVAGDVDLSRPCESPADQQRGRTDPACVGAQAENLRPTRSRRGDEFLAYGLNAYETHRRQERGLWNYLHGAMLAWIDQTAAPSLLRPVSITVPPG